MYKFLRFPDWKDKVVSLSYDDGAKDDIRLIEIMQKYGLKGTFNLCSGRLIKEPNERTSLDLYRQANMEVAMHGADHLWVKACVGGDIVREFYQDKLALEELTGGIIRGGAYAYGGYSEEALAVLKTLGLSYFRTTQETTSFDIPNDWLRMPITCRHKDTNLFTVLDRFLVETDWGSKVVISNDETAYTIDYTMMGESVEMEFYFLF